MKPAAVQKSDTPFLPLIAAVQGEQPQQKRRGRLPIWDFTDNYHCSVVGTCTTADDLRKLARKHKITFVAGTLDYGIHGYFVDASRREQPISRSIQKLLDDRYSGALRMVNRAKDEKTLSALWIDMRDRGQIAAAYWAFMTHTHVSDELRAAIFGEVHMLSHLAGTSLRKQTVESASLRDQLNTLQARALRSEERLRKAVEKRDKQIAELQALVDEGRVNGANPVKIVPKPRKASQQTLKMQKLERALISARTRARQAEVRAKHLDHELTQARKPQVARPAPAPEISAAKERHADIDQTLTGLSILYVGGRQGQFDQMRSIADEFDATLLVHDGGMEDATRRLDHLLPSADCVLCPITCVSHDACLRAKKACQRLNTPFLPLRSASLSSFRQALEGVAQSNLLPVKH